MSLQQYVDGVVVHGDDLDRTSSATFPLVAAAGADREAHDAVVVVAYEGRIAADHVVDNMRVVGVVRRRWESIRPGVGGDVLCSRARCGCRKRASRDVVENGPR